MRIKTSVTATIISVFSIALAVFWLKLPELKIFVPQLLAAIVIIYIIVKIAYQFKNNWLPTSFFVAWEIGSLLLASLLLIGSTGNTQSVFFTLIYLVIIFLVMTTSVSTSVAAGAGIVIFLASLVTQWSAQVWASIFSVPIFTIVFILIKLYYWTIKEQSATSFLNYQVLPQLEKIQNLILEIESEAAATSPSLLEEETLEILDITETANFDSEEQLESTSDLAMNNSEIANVIDTLKQEINEYLDNTHEK